jgi:mannose/fructose-specific phosphotransferase system component IIA
VSRVPALLVTHADVGAALVAAARQVYGPFEDVGVLSNAGLARTELERLIHERVAAWPHGGLVLTDFPGGSCQQCGLLAGRGHAEIVVVSGINLPGLLDYLHNRDRYPVGELAERLMAKARDSVRVQRPPLA